MGWRKTITGKFYERVRVSKFHGAKQIGTPFRHDQTDRPTYRQTDRQIDRQTGRPADRPTDRPTDRQTDRPTDRPTDRLTHRPGSINGHTLTTVTKKLLSEFLSTAAVYTIIAFQ